MTFLTRVFSPCLFGHSRDWTWVIVHGVWMKACDRCQTPYAAILAHRGEQEDIGIAKVPAIVQRHAVKAKRAKRPSRSLRFPRRVS